MTALRPMKLLQVDPASTPASVEVGVDQASGGASVQVPIPLTPGRDGFGPSLALAFGGYDPLSPFAHGWSLSGLPSIDIDTRDGLPTYDGRERFRFQGQDLIPLGDVNPSWSRGEYDVRTFRARIETVPIRAEQWTERSTGRVHWRVRTGDGTVQVFGRRADDESRIADPREPRRTFRWLLEAAYDRLGNAMLVRYEGEDDADVERPSLDASRFAGATANRYPKRILYGNAAPLAEDDDTSAAEWHFESVFDYGDHDAAMPQPEPSAPWLLRQDIGFTARPGFELRTRRLCRRVLMFHHFPTELGEPSTLVGSLEVDLDESPDATTLNGVRYVGWRTEDGARVSEATPWATFQYTSAGTEDAFEVLEAPLLGEQTQLVDLFGEGLPGLLTMDGGGARFASNLGDGAFGAHQPLPEWPTGLEGATLADFDGDGNVELVQLTGPNAGYFRLDRRSRRWESLKRFPATLNVDPRQGSVLQADLSGDGRPDLVLLHGSGLTWFPNQGARGFGDPIEVRLPAEKLPVANRPLDRFLADMTGDGLADIVEVLNGSVRYWPNLGRGLFGAPVVMDDAPRLDAEGCYDAARVLLVDLDQTGAADLVYLRGDGVVLRASNRRGASFGPLTPIAWGPSIPNGARLELADVYGDGSRCLVWTAPSSSGAAAFHALRLVSAPGARQIQAVTHPLGSTTELEWGHSVRHYLRDVETGRGWDTPLPAQHPVVDVLRRTEPIDGQAQSERFVYHDGHYDPRERSFALFAVVDHFDVDTARPALDVIPLMTRRFSHTGEVDYSKRFARHHYAGDLSPRPPPVSDVQGSLLLTTDLEEAFRALMGTPAREEVYATDAQGIPAEHPFHTTATSHRARAIRAADAQFRTGAQVIPQDTLTTAYEQSADDARETLQRVLEVDAYLTPVVAMEAGLPRGETLARFDAQARLLAKASRGHVVHLDTPERFELAIPAESWTYEVRVPSVDDAFAETLASELNTAFASATPYDQPLDPLGSGVAARELTHDRAFYWDDARTSALPLESVGLVTLPHHTEQAAYDRGQVVSVFGTRIDRDADLPAMGYFASGDVFYQQGPITRFSGASSFYRLEETEAFDGGVQRVVSDPHSLVAQQATDEVGNSTIAAIDYHVLAPWRLTDPNGSVQEIDYDPLGVARRTSRYGTAMDASGALVPHGFGALTRGQPRPTFDAALAAPETELGAAESMFVYEFASGGQPMRTLSLSAEQFVDRGPEAGSAPARAQVAVTYLDGFGRELQQRTLVEPGLAWTEDVSGALVEAQVSTRWRVSGHAVLDDKQQPTKQYEPFFRDAAEFEPELSRRQFGAASTTHYDALGRTVRQDLPNDTFTETRFAAWERTSYDPNDTSARATDYRAAREGLPTTAPERRALDQALLNAETPVSVHLDALGREIATVEVIEAARELVEEARLDIRGLSEATIDRRGLTASARSYDRLGRLLFERSVDAGEHRGLFDAQDREVRHWHETTEERRVFDLAGRVLERHVTDGGASWLAERMTYGEGASDAADRNQRGQLILLEDGAGQVRTTRYGAFGEPLEVERTLTQVPGLDPDWSTAVALESTGYQSTSAFDALGRRARASLPDGTEREEDYLQSGPLSELRVRTPDGQTRTILAGADYNARGQQTKSELGNGVEVTSTYDAQTFRLYQRRAVLPGTDPHQDLRHHYDPVGNLIYLDDLAQRPTATRVINGLTVTAERTYRYDARYQLTEATGRVHNALTQPDFRGDAPTSGSFRGTRRVGLNDGGAVSRYQRTYTYDDGGNLTGWAHGPQGTNPGNTWTNEKWVSPTSNRSFPAYDLNGVAVSAPDSKFDARGQLKSLPSVRAMEWSVRGQLRRTVLIERAGGTDDDERYDYAADGVRLRKTTRREVDGSTEIAETIYLDGCELRRVTRNSIELLLRWSSHAEGGDQRLATIYRWETDTQARETDDITAVRTHYHLGTHLGSVALELGAAGELLSYEEHFPYGRTAFVAGDAIREIKLRTLRFVGKDQDDATGFYAFQYRYYAPFLGNWVSPDPAGEVDGPNRYAYARNNPTSFVDVDGLQATRAPNENLGEYLSQFETFDDFLAAYEATRRGTTSPDERAQLRQIFERERAEYSESLMLGMIVLGGVTGGAPVPGLPAARDAESSTDGADGTADASMSTDAVGLPSLGDVMDGTFLRDVQRLIEARRDEQFDIDDRTDIAVALGIAGQIVGEVILGAAFEEIRDALVEAGLAATVGGPAAATIMLALAVGQIVYAAIDGIDAETYEQLTGAVSNVIAGVRSGTATNAEIGGLFATALQLAAAAVGIAAVFRSLPGAIRAMRGQWNRLVPAGAGAPIGGDGAAAPIVHATPEPSGPMSTTPSSSGSGGTSTPPNSSAMHTSPSGGAPGGGNPSGGGGTGSNPSGGTTGTFEATATQETVIVDTNTARSADLAQADPSMQSLQEGERRMAGHVQGRSIAVTPEVARELANGGGAGATIPIIRRTPISPAEEAAILADLEGAQVGGAGGTEDRQVVLEALTADTAAGVSPTLASGDRQVVNGLARLAGIAPNRLGGYRNVAEYLHYTRGVNSFSVTIQGRTLTVEPIQPIRPGLGSQR